MYYVYYYSGKLHNSLFILEFSPVSRLALFDMYVWATIDEKAYKSHNYKSQENDLKLCFDKNKDIFVNFVR